MFVLLGKNLLLSKHNKSYQSRWLKPTQTSVVWSLYRKSSSQGVLSKRVSLRKTAVQKKKKKYSWLRMFSRENVPMWWKGLTLEGKSVTNPSVSLSPKLAKNEKVEHYIRIKTHKSIVLRFWMGWEWCQCLIWLDSGLIGVCSSQWKSSL